MSTAAASPTLHADVPTPMRSKPTSLVTLSAVELRKAVDTRSGRWLLIVVGILALGSAAIGAFAVSSDTRRFETVSQLTFNFVGLVLPVVGILMMTSDWSQRSALTTFALTPRRSRVLVAKLVGALAIAVAGWAVAFLAAVLGTAVARRPAGFPAEAVWGLSTGRVLEPLLWMVLTTMLGVAFGLAFLNSAAAIVLTFVLPLVWTILSSLVTVLREHVQPWLDTNTSWNTLLSNDLSGRHWLEILTTTAVWVLLPGAIGAYRMLTREVS